MAEFPKSQGAASHGAVRIVRRIWRHSRYRRIVWAFLIAAIWCIIVPPVYLAYLREGGNADTAVDVQGEQSPDHIEVTMIVQQADLMNHKLSMYVTATPYGKLTNRRSELTANVTGYFAYKSFVFPSNSIMQSFDLTVPLLGYPRMYPFDDYQSFLEVGFVYNDADKTPIPIRVTIYGSVQSLSFDTDAQLATNMPNAFDFNITTRRTRTTLFFSIFMMIVMWGLSLTLLTLAYQIVIERRDVPAPLLIVGITMLFALPALRNSQPGVPQVGCASDALSFFWNLFLIAACSISIILAWVLRWKYRSPTPRESICQEILPTSQVTDANPPFCHVAIDTGPNPPPFRSYQANDSACTLPARTV
ncbi:hypothetical protein H4R33_005232 [Dimargaris cristalligena]|uniref:DUF4436 domain-containing protein n=1 Tax=Dimargaris cristalligena TaxID=215637 RepID=A0A4Q0A193_9FUNG|nr:hypothetical protein H4R33_005232 [Dimargaris cristalligena]RKP39528.1 hypothetical protein BJ085DRAFT_30949 [Dimargaris cristalligena]|eukprot:RKP39528.1 hypothetical protein BJ085DRAFT_30949 [Dimargaris cristalligena]